MMGTSLMGNTGLFMATGGGTRLGASMPGIGGKKGSEGFYQGL